MQLIVPIYFFLIGTCIGSFLNVVVDRIPQGKSILKGRSHCDYCQHVLSLWDLFPVLSFMLLWGKCRYCHRSLSFQYPLIELATGVLFVLSYVAIGQAISGVGLILLLLKLALVANFFALSVMDIKYGILSDKLVLFAAVITTLLYIQEPFVLLMHGLVGLACLAVLMGLFLFTKGKGIGLGDVKLSFVMGYLLGFPMILIAFYLAFLTGGLVAIILVLAKKRKLVGGTIAFGPFLLLGTYVSWLFGNFLWTLILHLLGN